MRKSLVVFLVLPVLVLAVVMYAMAGEKKWFDMQNCEMCKPILDEDPALMQNMTWEHHSISNGLVSVSTVAPAYMARKLPQRVDCI